MSHNLSLLQLLLAVGLTFSGADYVQAQKPIPNGKDAYTDAAYRKDLLAYRLTTAELYGKCTDDPPKVREAAAKFVVALVKREYLPAALPAWDKLTAQGKQLVKDGSHDPLVLTCLARCMTRSDELRGAKEPLEEAIRRFGISKYPAGAELSGARVAATGRRRSQRPWALDAPCEGLY